jgi:FG-GAP repeat protein
VSGVGDVNGDGFADVALGVPQASPNVASSGQTYVVFGKADTTSVELTDIVEGIGGFALDGEASSDLSGSVTGAGDVNGDGLADLVIGAPGHGGAGRSYVVYGKADTERVQLGDIAMGEGGLALDGEGAVDNSGYAVGGGGDVNGDGVPDLLIGAPSNVGAAGPGRAYVVFGVPTGGR